MTKKIKVADLPEFDMAEHLDSEQAMAEYLTIVLEENDPSALAGALGSIARARVHERDCQGIRHYPRSPVQGSAPRCATTL
jgi:hypothetical protein